MNRFDGRVVLVTGAASGIGRATVVRLAAEGATVAALDVNADGLAETLANVDGSGGPPLSLVCDITDESRVAGAMDEVIERFGRLDVLCSMAGILAAKHSHEVTLGEWNRIISVNLTGTFVVVRAALPHLLASRGNIVLAASTASLSGHPWMLAYAASKGGVLSMTKTLAMEYARRGLRVNAVAPGGITTPMSADVRLPDDADFSLLDRISPLDEFRGPETVASVIAFLASDDGAHVNGEYIRVDGATLA